MSNRANDDRALVQRGDISLWISTDVMDAWKPAPPGRRGGQKNQQIDELRREALALLDLRIRIPDLQVRLTSCENLLAIRIQEDLGALDR